MNPLLTPQEQAHVASVRALQRFSGNDTPTLSNGKQERIKQTLDTLQRFNLFKHATNALALGFVGFYLLTFTSIAGDGNHIYTVYRLFPVIASVGITLAIWRLPTNSLLRLFYLAGLFVVSWIGA
ncbi:hypothetical protein [Thiothrix subterranea]|uniref:Uncharacterized protein n=1 Tax=Thiothrix subterranea TaxID=2735563 RepID=A0AA51MML2_9GAMM|nr:hypothetical protein [Thiothrix subterranea]MDQ5770823.1 hypothetical protein [Thiothrix subterranea]WML87259.1 hypothetical protein RCG00_02610 [Thiothrix subterranea]